MFQKFGTKNHRTKIGAFCSPTFHLKILTSIVVDGSRVLEKIGFDFFFEKSQKTGKNPLYGVKNWYNVIRIA